MPFAANGDARIHYEIAGSGPPLVLQDRPALEDVLANIAVPCLLYTGDRDGILSQVSAAAEGFPAARLVILEGLNYPESFYRGDLVLPHALEFLRQARRN